MERTRRLEQCAALGCRKALDRVAESRARDGRAVLEQKGLQSWHVGLACLAQQPACGLVHEVFPIGEVLAHKAIGQIEMRSAAGERHQRHQGGPPNPERSCTRPLAQRFGHRRIPFKDRAEDHAGERIHQRPVVQTRGEPAPGRLQQIQAEFLPKSVQDENAEPADLHLRFLEQTVAQGHTFRQCPGWLEPFDLIEPTLPQRWRVNAERHNSVFEILPYALGPTGIPPRSQAANRCLRRLLHPGAIHRESRLP